MRLAADMRSDLDAWRDRHACRQAIEAGLVMVEQDADGEAAHDLGEIARGIVGWNDREVGTARTLAALYRAAEAHPGYRVDRRLDAITGSDAAELRFAQIRLDPQAAGRGNGEK